MLSRYRSPIETDYIAAHGFLEIWDDTQWCSKYVAIFLSRFLSWFSSPEECSGYFHENGDSTLNVPKNTIELNDVESLKTILNSRTISLSIGSRIFIYERETQKTHFYGCIFSLNIPQLRL